MSSRIWEPVDARAKELKYGTLLLKASIRRGQVYLVEITQEVRKWTQQDVEGTEVLE